MARSRVSLRNAHTLTHFYPAVQRKTQHHALTPIVFNISLQCICNRKQDINFINTCASSLRWLVSEWREAHCCPSWIGSHRMDLEFTNL